VSFAPAGEPEVPDHLDADEVLQIIDFMADCDPIIVGGQSVNIWAEYYAPRDPALGLMGPFTSKDVDFYQNRQAAEQLAEHLDDGQILLPGVDDAGTPNAAVVVGNLCNRRIYVDFMAAVLGVDDNSITRNFVSIEGVLPSGRSLTLCLMHPLDCVRSRLANINRLKRYDHQSLRQAMASLSVLGHFIDDLLALGDTRAAQKSLHALPYVVRDMHLGRATYTRFGGNLDFFALLDRYADDERLDPRWRERTFKRAIERERDRIARFEAQKAERASRQADNSNEPGGEDDDDEIVMV
jgi:hypothetical protein